MELYTYPITVEREGRKYYAYSEDFPGVYGLGQNDRRSQNEPPRIDEALHRRVPRHAPPDTSRPHYLHGNCFACGI